MIRIETERLLIRNFTPEDWKDLLEISQKYEKTEMAKYDQQFPQTEEDMKHIVNWIAKGDGFAAVVLRENPKVIGLLQFQRRGEIKKEIVHGFGYVFNSDYQGNGFATEASKEILNFVFKEFKAKRIVAGTAAVNTKSCKLLERLGFREIKRKKASFRKDSKGNPIEFIASEYELKQDDWNTKGI